MTWWREEAWHWPVSKRISHVNFICQTTLTLPSSICEKNFNASYPMSSFFGIILQLIDTSVSWERLQVIAAKIITATSYTRHGAQFTGKSIACCSTICSGLQKQKNQGFASLALCDVTRAPIQYKDDILPV